MTVLFLSQNRLSYLAPVFDPWFSANGTHSHDVGLAENVSTADQWVTVMGCAERYRMCNPTTSSCTPWAGQEGLRDSVMHENIPGYGQAQLATASRLILAVTTCRTNTIVTSLGAGSLWANNLAFGNIAPGLPDNQWQTEVLGWFQTILSKLQADVLDFTSNPREKLGPLGNVTSPYDAKFSRGDPISLALQHQCENQLVQTQGEVQNFNFVGVLVLVCCSVALIVIDLALERLISLAYRCWGWWPTAKHARQADDKLHLLCMALGPREGHSWRLGHLEVPVIDGNVLFDMHNISEELGSYSSKTRSI